MATQDSRIKLKRSTIAATVPTVPSSNDHTDGTWIATDIYKGELFYNQADGVLWTRGDSGIDCIQGSAKVVIPTAQVLTLNTTPIALGISVPTGTIAVAQSAIFYGNFNSVAYATNVDIGIKTVGTTDFQLAGDDFLNFSVSRILSMGGQTSTATSTDNQFITGADLEVYAIGGNPTAGDSDITIYVTYRIITL